MATKRAILYARVSSDDRANDGRNLRGQLDMCRQHALAQGWTVIGELAEDERGASGARLDLPKLNELLELAQRGEFEVLVVRELDRLSRSLSKQLRIEELLSAAEVQIEYVLGDYPDTPEGRFMKNVRAAVAELERLKIHERNARGRLQAVKTGRTAICRAPYGYETLEEEHNYQLRRCEVEAMVVRRVFAWYTIGDEDGVTLSASGIAQRLTDLGIPTYAQSRWRNVRPGVVVGRWSPRTIYGILINTVYKGEWRTRKVHRSDGQKIPTPTEEQLVVAVPPIVDAATWHAAQAQLVANRHETGRSRQCTSILSGHIWCDLCNTRAFGKLIKPGNYKYYVCGAICDPYYHGQACSSRRFRGEPIEKTVWAWIVSLVTNAEVRATALQAQRLRWNEQAALLRAQLREIDAQVQTLEMQDERLLDLYLTSALAKQTWSRRHEALQRQLHQLRDEQTKQQVEIKKYTLNEEHLQEIHRHAIQLLARTHTEEHTFDLQRKLFALLDLNVRLCLDAEDRQYLQAGCMLGQETFVLPGKNTA